MTTFLTGRQGPVLHASARTELIIDSRIELPEVRQRMSYGVVRDPSHSTCKTCADEKLNAGVVAVTESKGYKMECVPQNTPLRYKRGMVLLVYIKTFGEHLIYI